MEYYHAPPAPDAYHPTFSGGEQNQLYTSNYVADTKLEYLIRMSNHFKVPIGYLPHHLGSNYWLNILFHTIIVGDLSEMERIMVTQGIDINVTMWKNPTPIWYATSYGHFNLVQHLLLRGAIPNIYDRARKMSCLDVALKNKFKRCAYLLLAYNATTFNKILPMLEDEVAAPIDTKV